MLQLGDRASMTGLFYFETRFLVETQGFLQLFFETLEKLLTFRIEL